MIEEKIIVGENTKYPLNGLLTLPDNITNPVPAVVFVHGSGASNMDEKVGKPFRREVMRTYGASVTPSPSMETAVGRKILAEHPGTTGSRRNGITPARTSDWKAESAERRSYRNQSTWFPRPDAHPFPRRGRIARWCRQTY